MSNYLEDQLEKAVKNLVRWKCRYKGLKKFLLAHGVSEELFEEYNKTLSDEYERKAKL